MPEQPGTEADAQPAPEAKDAGWSSLLGKLLKGRFRLSPAAVLLLNTFLMALVAGGLFSLLFWFQGGPPEGEAVSTVRRAPGAEPAASQPWAQPPTTTPEGQPVPVSWQMAESAYQAKNYELAGQRYQQLLAVSKATPANAVLSDFFRFRIARCLARLGRLEQAETLLAGISRSDSPILRAAASYDLSVLDYLAGNYLTARTKAYFALAALGAMEAASPLEADCDYLIARALTEKSLAFHETSLSVSLSRRWRDSDIFSGLDEESLRRLLDEGRGRAGQAVLGPQVKKAWVQRGALRYSVTCCQAPLEELLQRLALSTGLEVRWGRVELPARQRTVTVDFKLAPAQRVYEVACGMVGLAARFTGEQAIIHDLRSCKSLSEQRQLLYAEAISIWRRFLLRSPKDARVAQGHFAVAVLHECFADTVSAMKEYRLVAGRFSRDAVAGMALLRAARLRIRLRDYVGARSDLLDLLNLYPDCEYLDQVYLNLARASLQAGLLDEAIRDFEKLYYLDLSFVSRQQACRGAAQAFYAKADPERAATWVERYLKMSKEATGDEVAEAYLLLSKCLVARGQVDEAARAVHCALAARPSEKRRVEALLELALNQKRRSCLVEALRTLNEIDPELLGRRQRCQHLLARAQVYRAMGLAYKAAVLLRRELRRVTDEHMWVQIRLELARCCAAEGDLSAARNILAELLPKMKPGPEAVQAACELAEVCLRDGKAVQAVAVAQEILRSGGPDARRRVLQLLGQAYLQQQDYERAALAFSGMLAKHTGVGGK